MGLILCTKLSEMILELIGSVTQPTNTEKCVVLQVLVEKVVVYTEPEKQLLKLEVLKELIGKKDNYYNSEDIVKVVENKSFEFYGEKDFFNFYGLGFFKSFWSFDFFMNLF